jgi:hypothetical protein
MVLLTVYIAVLREKATMRELREDGGRVCLWQCAREATTRTRAIATDCQLHGFQFAGPTLPSRSRLIVRGRVIFLSLLRRYGRYLLASAVQITNYKVVRVPQRCYPSPGRGPPTCYYQSRRSRHGAKVPLLSTARH